jgi:type II restriction enzyme
MSHCFEELTSTFQSTISWWSYYCDFDKIEKNAFNIKIQLNILNSLLWEQDIEIKFLEIVKNYPKTREVLPILLAVREKFTVIWDKEKNIEEDVSKLFNPNIQLQSNDKEQLLIFFHKSWLKNIFQDKKISNLNDYVFWIETWLDSNARKSRSWKQMEDLIETYISEFCDKKWYCWKSQATLKYILETWWINIQNNKIDRRFDFAIYTWNDVYLIETNFFSWWWSKLKAVSWEFTELYLFLKKQNKQLYWFTDWAWWKTSKRSLEEAFNTMEWNIYNIKDLKDNILEDLIK